MSLLILKPPHYNPQILFVMPSSSARCAQLPRAVDKVPFYLALKKIRDYVRGELDHVDDSEVTFPSLDMKVKSEIKFDKEDEPGDYECVGDLTLEQIQTNSEYLEALAASAEGREIPAQKKVRRRLRVGSDDEDNAMNFQDDESSQSSCSSELLKLGQSDHTSTNNNNNNQGMYTLSKNMPGSTSFELIPDVVKEEQPYDQYEYGINSEIPTSVKQELKGHVFNSFNNNANSSFGSSRNKFMLSSTSKSSQPSIQTSASLPFQSASSPPLSPPLAQAHSNASYTPPGQHNTINVNSGSTSNNMTPWSHNSTLPPQHNGYSPMGEVNANDEMPRQPPVPLVTSGPQGPYMPPSSHPHPMTNHPHPYQPSSSHSPHNPQHPSTIHYHVPSVGTNSSYPPEMAPGTISTAMSSSMSSSPMHNISHCPPIPFKGRPPRYQWSNGANNGHSMMMGGQNGSPVPPAGNTHNYNPYMYSRGGNCPAGPYPPYHQGPSGMTKGLQGGSLAGGITQSSMSPSASSSQLKSFDKSTMKAGSNTPASYPSAHLPNFFNS